MKDKKRLQVVKDHSIIEKRKYILRLNETEVAILKGALKYWVLDWEFGYALWGIEAANYGSSDYYYLNIVKGLPKAYGLWDVIYKLCKVEPNCGGYWGDIDRLAKMCREKVDEFEKQAEQFEEDYGIELSNASGFSKEQLEQLKKEKEEREKQNGKS